MKGFISIKIRTHCYEGDMSPMSIAFSFSHEDFDYEKGRDRRRRLLMYDFRDLKVEALEFDDNLNWESYLDGF